MSPEQKRKQLRREQLVAIEQGIDIIKNVLEEVKGTKRRRQQLLDSVALGLYDEIDKLCKRAPAESVTDLALEQVNEIIKETRELVNQDEYVQKLKQFIPAGDLPQYRDVVVVLRQIRLGLDRFREYLMTIEAELNGKLNTGYFLCTVLEMYLEGNRSVGQDDLVQFAKRMPPGWMTGVYPQKFDFGKLDKFDIRSFFGAQL